MAFFTREKVGNALRSIAPQGGMRQGTAPVGVTGRRDGGRVGLSQNPKQKGILNFFGRKNKRPNPEAFQD